MQCDLPGGISIHYESKGHGRPFLMLHGSPGDSSQANSQVEPAFQERKGWRRVYPDLPGHGKTPGAGRIRGMDDYLGVLLEFVDEVFPAQRFVLGGTSFGAYLALGIARQRVDRLDGLLLSVPMVNFGPREDRRAREKVASPDRSSPGPSRPRNDYPEDTTWLQTLPYRDLSFDIYRSPKPFEAPTLFLFGRQDASFRYREYAKRLGDFPRATFAVLDGAGHSLWNDQSALAGALVREWMSRVDAWAPGTLRSP
jgi:pimeloyl-ACP methyl ester carboxylesterase